MKLRSIVLVTLVLAATGCPHKSVAIYHKLNEGVAMQTCDANQRYRVETVGGDAKEARARGEAQIRSTVATHKGCGAYVFNEGTGKKLDGTMQYVADYQWCRCQ